MNSNRLLAASLGIVYLWFGALKIVDSSAAHELVGATVSWLPERVVVPLLGLGEALIGIGLFFPNHWRKVLPFFFLHMFCTTMPLVVLPGLCFVHFPFVPSMVGQYIFKNVILASAGYALWRSLPATASHGVAAAI